MPAPRSPDRGKAFEIYKEHNGDITNRRIAELLEKSEKTISGWKCKDKWDSKLNGVLQTSERSTPKKVGGQLGNKNAKGHGGTGPPGNKNAVKTGEFETLFFDTLEAEEKELINSVSIDKQQLLTQEIQLLTVRERRMLKRIEELKQSATALEDEEMEYGKAPPGMSVTKYTAGVEKGKLTDLKEYTGILGQIQSIEDALTRVQLSKQKAIDALHRFDVDDTKLELENMKLELTMLKQGGQDEGQEDDGFMDSIEEKVKRQWGEDES